MHIYNTEVLKQAAVKNLKKEETSILVFCTELRNHRLLISAIKKQ